MTNKEYLPLVDCKSICSIIHKIDIFGGLSDENLAGLVKLLKIVVYEKGERIFNQGDQPSYIYIVRSGKVKMVLDIDSEALELIEFGEGKCIGETSVIGIQPHTATALATEKTELIVLSRQALLNIFETNKDLFGRLILNIAREACRRLTKSDQTLLHYVCNDGRCARK